MNTTYRIFSVLLISAIILTGCSKKEPVQQPAPEEKPAPAETQTVPAGQLGCKATPLDGLTIVKGEPVSIEAGKVYVVEFWATWCGPCRTSIPHLTEMQKKLKDKGVTVIGVSNEAKDLEKVKAFVAEQGEKMDYTVAVDIEGKVGDGYMKAFGRGGIPAAFIVDGSGNVVWVGHPMAGMDETLEQVLAGTYDMTEYAAKVAEDKKKKEEAQLAYKKRYAELEAKIAQLTEAIEKDPDNVDLLLELAQVYLGNSFVTELSYNPGHLFQALQDYKKVLELDPEDAHNVTEHVTFFEAWNDRSDARLEKLNTFAEKYPDCIRTPFAAYALYYEANEKGDTAQALKYLTIAADAKLEGRFGEFIKQKKEALEATAP